MARHKLKLFKQYLKSYFLTPYAINIYRQGLLISKAFGSAKLDPIEISKNSPKYPTLYQKYFFQKKTKIGIDCSGLCFHLISKFSQLFHHNISQKITSSQGLKGVTKINAKSLVETQNSHPISFSDLKIGDIVSTNNFKHVLFVLENNQGFIKYIHSSRYANIPGVFIGYLFSLSPNHFNFSDPNLVNPVFFRPNYFSSTSSE